VADPKDQSPDSDFMACEPDGAIGRNHVQSLTDGGQSSWNIPIIDEDSEFDVKKASLQNNGLNYDSNTGVMLQAAGEGLNIIMKWKSFA